MGQRRERDWLQMRVRRDREEVATGCRRDLNDRYECGTRCSG